MSAARPRLLFVAPWFLFPTASGGRIRTVDILRGMKRNGHFEIDLVSPLPDGSVGEFQTDLDSICDWFEGWRDEPRSALTKALKVPGKLPVSVALDDSAAARDVISRALARKPDIVVFDFVHAAVHAPKSLDVPTVVFTHNVESEIYKRQADAATNPLKRMLWRNQLAKMQRFERAAMQRFDTIVAVSQRDADMFCADYGADEVAVIPTGVDMENFARRSEPHARDLVASGGKLVFTGTMDYLPNTDAIEWLIDGAWPKIAEASPATTLTVVGRNPPQKLIDAAKQAGLPWEFTGFVDDIRPYVHDADVYVIPLRIGGGTRLKVFEAMSMGCPVVSTTIGVEGLDIEADAHYLQADSPEDFAGRVIGLLGDGARRQSLADLAYAHVDANFSSRAVADCFERICIETLSSCSSASAN